jgi:hypothetical protein
LLRFADAVGWTTADLNEYIHDVYGPYVGLEELTRAEAYEVFKSLRWLLGFKKWQAKRHGQEGTLRAASSDPPQQ